MLAKVDDKVKRMNNGTTKDETKEDIPPPLVDTWERRGEYLVRRHNRPRDCLFGPTQWLFETGNKSIPVYGKDGTFDFVDLETLKDPVTAALELPASSLQWLPSRPFPDISCFDKRKKNWGPPEIHANHIYLV